MRTSRLGLLTTGIRGHSAAHFSRKYFHALPSLGQERQRSPRLHRKHHRAIRRSKKYKPPAQQRDNEKEEIWGRAGLRLRLAVVTVHDAVYCLQTTRTIVQNLVWFTTYGRPGKHYMISSCLGRYTRYGGLLCTR